MADSGSYSPETIARRQKIADALLLQSVKPREIRSPLQGLGQLGEAALAGWEGYRADNEEKSARKEAIAQAMQAFGGGAAATAAAPTAAPATPAAADPSMPATTLVGNNPDYSVPRGIRNNNPLNIEAGGFTQGQPGFAGSDGRFAKFETPEQGTAAASALLDSYGRRGLNTPAGIVGRWAPSGDGNNVSAYAQAVAKQLGIGPNDPIPPEMRPQLIAAMGQHENGRPIGNVALALNGPQPAAGAPPQGAPPSAPVQVAQNAPAPAAGAQGGRAAAIAAMLNPWTPPAMAAALASQINPSYGFQTLPDGTIVRTDPRHGTVQPIYQAPTKPTWGVIGETADGGKQYGWIDAGARAKVPSGGSGIEPYKAPGSSDPTTVTGPDGKPITIPAGVNAKEFVKRVSETTADAATGKKTEVQAKDEKFANKMELAEKNIVDVEGEGSSIKGRMLDAKIPGTDIGMVPASNFMQSSKYQQYRQAQNNFITALLRDESGAAIGTSEFARYEKELFPQPGDGKEVIAQKREARRVAIEAMKKGAGPAYKSPTPAAGPIKVASPEEAAKLPKGTAIILPDGSPGLVP